MDGFDYQSTIVVEYEVRLYAIDHFLAHKRKVERAYDIHFDKYFLEKDIIWKVILLISYKNVKYGKWSPI